MPLTVPARSAPERQASGETGTSSISRDTTTTSALAVSRPSIRYQERDAFGAARSVRPDGRSPRGVWRVACGRVLDAAPRNDPLRFQAGHWRDPIEV